jgi:type I restriction enzyme M protein
LFFEKGTPTKEIWYYEHKLPEGQKSYSKTKPIQFNEFKPLIDWWHDRKETDLAWKVNVANLSDFNLDIKNPNRNIETIEFSSDRYLHDLKLTLNESVSFLDSITLQKSPCGRMGNYRIGEFLKRIKRPIILNETELYQLVTIRMHHKGVIPRLKKKGADIKSKMFKIESGDFILSGIDARNGAFGIAPEELNNAIVTNDFWYFELDESIIDKQFFLELTSTNWFDDLCNKGSDGTTQRIRLQKDKFFNQEISLPDIHLQKEVVSKMEGIKTLRKHIDKTFRNTNNLAKAILNEAFELEDARAMP